MDEQGCGPAYFGSIQASFSPDWIYLDIRKTDLVFSSSNQSCPMSINGKGNIWSKWPTLYSISLWWQKWIQWLGGICQTSNQKTTLAENRTFFEEYIWNLRWFSKKFHARFTTSELHLKFGLTFKSLACDILSEIYTIEILLFVLLRTHYIMHMRTINIIVMIISSFCYFKATEFLKANLILSP